MKTTTYGAKLNLPPMKAFRAPGFVEGTFGLESLLDELAAKLDLDPLELRRLNHTEHDPTDGQPFSSKNLLECYRRAEPHWERRHEVRARSTDTVKRGVGMASQIWYGGGGPPSYAWIRVGSDGRATVVTAMQDIGTGSRTAMAQIAAEELGIPLEHVTVSLGDSARGPFASISAGSSTIAVDGAGRARRGRRREAADPRDRGAAPPVAEATSPARREIVSADGSFRTARGARRRCSRTRRSSARARAARTRRACRCSRSACRSPRSPSTSRRARCGSTGSPPCTTSAA